MIYGSALKRRVREDDIWDMLSLRPHQLEFFGFGDRDTVHDLRYESRSTKAQGFTSGGRLLELVLRLDRRAGYERCIVFHGRYL